MILREDEIIDYRYFDVSYMLFIPKQGKIKEIKYNYNAKSFMTEIDYVLVDNYKIYKSDIKNVYPKKKYPELYL